MNHLKWPKITKIQQCVLENELDVDPDVVTTL